MGFGFGFFARFRRRKKRIPAKDKETAGFLRIVANLSKESTHTGRPFLEKGLKASVFKDKGMNARFLRENFGIGTIVLREIGFSASEILKAGSTPLGLVQAGFKAQDLKEAGIRIQQISSLGAGALLDIGFTVKELVDAGAPKEIMKKALEKNVRDGGVKLS